MSGLQVRIRAAGEQYAVPVDGVLEVAELGEVTPVPGASATIMGVRNLRGQVIPVVDLGRVLEVPDATAPERLVIAEDAGRKVALAVDEVIGVDELPEASEEVASPHLMRAALAGGALVGVIDLPSILAAVGGEPSHGAA